MSQASAVTVRILDGFDDSAIDEHAWRQLQRSGPTDEVFLTYWWQKAWWDVFGRGQLLMIGVYRDEELIGLAPLFASREAESRECAAAITDFYQSVITAAAQPGGRTE